MIIDVRGMILHSISLQRKEVNLLTKYRYRLIVSKFQIPHEDWVRRCVKKIDLDELQASLFKSELVYITDRSFYLDKSHLVAAAWITVVKDK